MGIYSAKFVRMQKLPKNDNFRKNRLFFKGTYLNQIKLKLNLLVTK